MSYTQLNDENITQTKILNKEENPPGIIPVLYDPDRIPPDVEFAKTHGKAKRVGNFNINLNGDIKVDLCDCCGLPIENELLDLWCDRVDLGILGPGFPLYFQFIYFCCIMMISLFLTHGIYALYSNIVQGDCKLPSNCHENFVTRLAWSNIIKSPLIFRNQSWLNLVAVIIILISLLIFRKKNLETEDECDRGLQSASDYTLILSNLPPSDYTKQDVINLCLDAWRRGRHVDDNEELKISKVTLSYDISKHVELCREKDKKILEKKKALEYQKKENKYPKGFTLANIEVEIKSLQEKIDEEADHLEIGINNNNKVSDKAFVTFSSIRQLREFKQRLELNIYEKISLKLKKFFGLDITYDAPLLLKNKIIKIERAPEPNDVLWENIGYTRNYKYKKRVITFFMTLVLIAIGWGILFGLSVAQDKINSLDDRTTAQILGFLASLAVLIVNTFLFILLMRFSDSEKRSTITSFNVSLAQKLCFSQFFNSGLTVFLVNLIVHGTSGFHKLGGFIFDLWAIYISISFVPPLVNLFDIWWCNRLMKRKSILQENIILTQREANGWFEGPSINMSSKYSAVIKIVWIACLYNSIFPLLPILAIAGLLLAYWVDKYLLLRRYCRPHLLSSDLNNEMVELLEFCPFFLSFGSFIFNIITYDFISENLIPDYIGLGLSLFNLFFPIRKIFKVLQAHEEENDIILDESFEDARIKFTTEYDRTNPVLQTDAMRDWIDYLEKGGNAIEAHAAKMLLSQLSQSQNATSDKKKSPMNFLLHNYAKNFKNASESERHVYFKGAGELPIKGVPVLNTSLGEKIIRSSTKKIEFSKEKSVKHSTSIALNSANQQKVEYPNLQNFVYTQGVYTNYPQPQPTNIIYPQQNMIPPQQNMIPLQQNMIPSQMQNPAYNYYPQQNNPYGNYQYQFNNTNLYHKGQQPVYQYPQDPKYTGNY